MQRTKKLISAEHSSNNGYPKTNSMEMFSMQLSLDLKLTQQDKIEIEVVIFKLQWTFPTKFDINSFSRILENLIYLLNRK